MTDDTITTRDISALDIFRAKFADELVKLTSTNFDPELHALASKYGATWKPNWSIKGMSAFECGTMKMMRSDIAVSTGTNDSPEWICDQIEPKLKRRRFLMDEIEEIVSMTSDSEIGLRQEMLTMYFGGMILDDILVTERDTRNPKCKIYICMNIRRSPESLIHNYILDEYGINIDNSKENVRDKYHSLFYCTGDGKLYNMKERGKDEDGKKLQTLTDDYEWYHLKARYYETSNCKPLTAADRKRFVKIDWIDPRFTQVFIKKVQDSSVYKIIEKGNLQVEEVYRAPKRERHTY